MPGLAPALSRQHDNGNAPALGGSRARPAFVRPVLTAEIVYRVPAKQGHYGNSPAAYLPMNVFLAVHGEAALAERQTITTTYHWDSGWPDTYADGPKWEVVDNGQDPWVACERELRKHYPWFNAQCELRDELNHAYAKLTELRKGLRARVVKGRKVPVGTEGEVMWIGEQHYGGATYRNGRTLGGRTSTRVGLRDDAGTVHWTAWENCIPVVDGDDMEYHVPEGLPEW